MGTKSAPIPPCAEISIQIGQTMSAIESVQRSEWSLKESCVKTLSGHLGDLQNQFSKNCG